MSQVALVHTGNAPHQTAGLDNAERAKRYGLAHGYAGRHGGWIYNRRGDHCAHGWEQFYFWAGERAIANWEKRQALEATQ